MMSGLTTWADAPEGFLRVGAGFPLTESSKFSAMAYGLWGEELAAEERG